LTSVFRRRKHELKVIYLSLKKLHLGNRRLHKYHFTGIVGNLIKSVMITEYVKILLAVSEKLSIKKD